MTALLNEFWMFPLHGEAAIDRFVLNNAAITNRMFYWNRCRSKIKAKKLFKNVINKIKEFSSTTTESVEELFGNVPFVVDNKNICLNSDIKENNIQTVQLELTEPFKTPFNFNDTMNIFIQALNYFEKQPFVRKLLKEYYMNRQEFLNDFVFSKVSKTDFVTLSPSKIDDFPNLDSFNFEECFYNEMKAEKLMNDYGDCNVEDIRLPKTFINYNGKESLTDDLSFYPVNKLYYPENDDDNESDYVEENIEDFVTNEIKMFFPFLFDDVILNELNESETNTLTTEKTDFTTLNKSIIEAERLTIHQFGNLYDGQLGYPIKNYYFTKYYGRFYTDADKIIVLYKKMSDEYQSELPDYVPADILTLAPDKFTEEYDINELQMNSNILTESLSEGEDVVDNYEIKMLLVKCCTFLKEYGIEKKTTKKMFELLQKIGFEFTTDNNNINIQSPLLNFSNEDNICNYIKRKLLKQLKKIKKRRFSKRSNDENAKQSSNNLLFDSKRNLNDKRVNNNFESAMNFNSSLTANVGLEKEFEESDESQHVYERQNNTQNTDNIMKNEINQEEPNYSGLTGRKRKWDSIFATNDINIDEIDLNTIDLDFLIPEKQREIDEVDKDTKDYLVETPDFRRYLRKANAEVTNIKKLVLQLKKTLGHEDIPNTPVVKNTRRKKLSIKKQQQKQIKEPMLEMLSPKELITQILESRKKYEDIVREHREEGQAKKKQTKENTDSKSLLFDPLDGPRQTKARITCLNENTIVKAAFQMPSSNSLGSGKFVERTTKSVYSKRASSYQDEYGDRKRGSIQYLQSAFKTSNMKNSSKQKSVSINEAATITHEMSPNSSANLMKRRSKFLRIVMRAVDDDGNYKWYRVVIPEHSPMFYRYFKGNFEIEEKMLEKEVKVVEKTLDVKEEIVVNAEYKDISENLIDDKDGEQHQEKIRRKEKLKRRKRNELIDLYSEKQLIRQKIFSMLPKEELIYKDYNYDKMLKLDCRKIGDYLYLMFYRKEKWTIISRIPVVDELLAYETSNDILEELKTSEYIIKTPGEDTSKNYNELINQVIHYEKLCNVAMLKWNKNAGIIGLSGRNVQINMNADYSIDKRFLRSDLPIIGTLIIRKPAHSFAAIPLHYPLTTFGTSKRCMVQLSMLAPECHRFGLEHATIYYDKLSLKVFLQACYDYETIVDGKLYGGNIYSKNTNKCECSDHYKQIKHFGERPTRAIISDNTSIQIGCLNLSVILMPLQQIWAEIPGACSKLTAKDRGICTSLNMNDNPNISDDDLNNDVLCISDIGEDM